MAICAEANAEKINLDKEEVLRALDEAREEKHLVETSYNVEYGMSYFMEWVYDKINSVCDTSKDMEHCMDNNIQGIQNFFKELLWHTMENSYTPRPKHIEDQDVSEALSALDSKCSKNCDNPKIGDYILAGSDQNYRKLYKKTKTTNPRCQAKVINTVVQQFSNYHVPKHCLEKNHAENSECEDILKYVNRSKSRFLEMLNLVYEQDTESMTKARSICAECIFVQANESDKNFLLNLTRTLQEKSKCTPLQAGEQRMVSAGTGKARFYQVKKEKDGTYSIPLFINFYAGKNYDGDVPASEVPTHYIQKVQKCLDEVSSKMLNTKTGEKLQIKVAAPNKVNKQACTRHEIHNIEIEHSSYRSDEKNYESDIDCPIITHEVLHLLGLHDEYEDSENGIYIDSNTGLRTKNSHDKHGNENPFKAIYNCRVVQENSFMADHTVRWDNVFVHNKNKSLLDPGHFNAILYGNCSKNKDFNECSNLAFQGSHYYEGRIVDNSTCIEKNKKCVLKNILGKDKQKIMHDIQADIKKIEDEIAYWKSPNLVKYSSERVELLDKKKQRIEKKLQIVEAWPDN